MGRPRRAATRVVVSRLLIAALAASAMACAADGPTAGDDGSPRVTARLRPEQMPTPAPSATAPSDTTTGSGSGSTGAGAPGAGSTTAGGPASSTSGAASRTVDPPTGLVAELFSSAVDAPVDLVVAPRDPAAGSTGPDRFWVADKGGTVVELDGSGSPSVTVLDVSNEVSDGSEQGLLAIAVDPGATRLFVHLTDPAGDTAVLSYRLAGSPPRPQPSTRATILRVEQPFANHNGGQLAFGPDGYLYLGLGDGGSANDPRGNGQNLTTLLGKLLRLDVSAPDGHGIPPGNPFAAGGGAPEIWAWGLRNPWRFSFDTATGDLWIGDVGQNALEEIDLLPAGPLGAGRGANLGWSAFEGTSRRAGVDPLPGALDPIYEYDRSGGGCSVTGGVVVRGGRSGLDGWYVFGDYCRTTVEGLVVQPDRRVVVRDLFDVPEGRVAAFATGPAGALYVLALDPGRIYRVAGGR